MPLRPNNALITLLSAPFLLGPLTGSGCSSRKLMEKKLKLTRVADDSRTPECRQEIAAAVQRFRGEFGLAFQTISSDADGLVRTGRLTKQYARDGVRYEVGFAVSRHGGGCNLIFYKRSKNEPGRVSIRTGLFGKIKLTKCRCK